MYLFPSRDATTSTRSLPVCQHAVYFQSSQTEWKTSVMFLQMKHSRGSATKWQFFPRRCHRFRAGRRHGCSSSKTSSEKWVPYRNRSPLNVLCTQHLHIQKQGLCWTLKLGIFFPMGLKYFPKIQIFWRYRFGWICASGGTVLISLAHRSALIHTTPTPRQVPTAATHYTPEIKPCYVISPRSISRQ